MKIKKMIDCCKQNKNITFFNTDTEQWICDGFAIFPLYDMPRFDGASICLTYDITEKQQKKICFRTESGLPERMDFNDICDGESLVECGNLILLDGGMKLIPYMTSQGIAFIDGKYLGVVADYEDGMLELYERHTKDGQMYFAIKSGFVLVGIVMPVKVVTDEFVNRLKSLATQCEIALFNQNPNNDNSQQTLEEGYDA